MTFRPGPLRSAVALAAAFTAARVVYRVLFHGADGSGAVLLPLPVLRVPPPFAHVTMLGPVTVDGLWTAAASALPIAAAIIAFGALNSFFELHRVLARAGRRGPLRGVARVVAVAWAMLPSLADAARAVRFAQRLREPPARRPPGRARSRIRVVDGARMLLPLLERTLERAGAVATALELRGFAGWPVEGDCLEPVVARDLELGFEEGSRRPDAVGGDADDRGGARHGVLVPSLALAPGTLTLLSGPTGSGKSTLLRAIAGLHEHADGGRRTGELRVVGHDRSTVPPRDLAQRVGVVLQRPRDAFATERVRDELGLALELRGVAAPIVDARVREVAERVGVAGLLDRPVHGLSAGEATLVAIAAAIVEQPILLLVDEPLADLDADARLRIASLLGALAHEAGMCVVVAEHRVEPLLDVADARLRIDDDGVVREGVAVSAPSALRLVPGMGPWAQGSRAPSGHRADAVVRARDVTVRRGGVTAVDAASIELTPGELVALVGPNGAGKSSLLAALALPDLAERGARVTAGGRVALVPDASDDLFVHDTVAAECAQADRLAARARVPGLGSWSAGTRAETRHPQSSRAGTRHGVGPGSPAPDRHASTTAERFAEFLGLDPAGAELAGRLARHPRDLSVGERRCLAIAIQLAGPPAALLVDEPTRGLDPAARDLVCAALESLTARGIAVLIASHEPDAVSRADRVIAMRVGVLASGGPRGDEHAGAPRAVGIRVRSAAADARDAPHRASAERAAGPTTTVEDVAAGAAPGHGAERGRHAPARPPMEAAEAAGASTASITAGGRPGAVRPGSTACVEPRATTPPSDAEGPDPDVARPADAAPGRGRTGAEASAPPNGSDARTARPRPPRSPWPARVALVAATLVALGAFCWPFAASAVPAQAQAAVPVAAIALAPLAALVVAATLDGTVRSAHALALLATLAAIGSAVRIASTGVGGVEAVFILLILAGRVFGARFGMLLGLATIALSSLLWGMIGPWTPFQMFACGWVGAVAGLLPRLPRRLGPRGEIVMLCGYGVIAAYAFGLLMNLWYWPFAVGFGTAISYDPTAPLGTNLASFLLYSLVTSTLGWDTLRAITTVVGILVVGRAVLAAFRRAKPVQPARLARTR